ncbi:MAG: hypothetical protein ACFFCS_02330 [Candidatus Hodarchaeota archaeon]
MGKWERLLFSAEFLTPGEIVKENAVELLANTGTMLSLRNLFADLEGNEYKLMLARFKDQGIEQNFIPWPMLDVVDGYYANEMTVEKFSTLIKKTLDWYCDNNFEIPLGVLVDLEPSVDPRKASVAEKVRKGELKVEDVKKKEKKGFDMMSFAGQIIDGIDENVNPERFETAARKFGEMQDMMHEYGTQAIAVALPLAYEDIYDGKLLIQDFMTCPVTNVDWDMINFMIFNVDYVHATRGLITNEDYRHILYSYGKEFVEKWGPEKASICLGVTTQGIQAVRPPQTDPELYRLECSALLAAGMENIGIYALDGVLKQPDPESWIKTVKQAKASDFEVDPSKLEFAGHVRKLFQALDFISPVAHYLVKSGKIMDIIGMLSKL